MDFLKKILGFILIFLEERRKQKEEDQESRKVQIETLEKVKNNLDKRKKELIKPSTDDDFFGDDV